MNKHTPGPWTGWFKQAKTVVDHPSRGMILEPPWVEGKGYYGFSNPYDVWLISAAPELLAACKSLLNIARLSPRSLGAEYAGIPEAEAAIAKAEGRRVLPTNDVSAGGESNRS